MFVYFTSIPKRYDHTKLESLTNFVLGKYFTKQKLFHVNLELIGKRTLFLKEGVYGYCTLSDYEDRSSPLDFEIEIDTSQKKEDFYTTLTHELVHMKQFMLCELQDAYDPTYKQLWKGVDMSDTVYSKQPWEREARSLEKKYLKEFFSLNKS